MSRLPILILICAFFISPQHSRGADDFSFGRDILPILSDNCFECHGPDASSREADLRLDLPEAFSQKTSSDMPVVAPGDLEDSELWYRITTDDDIDVMPPSDYPHQLTAGEKDLVRRWIEAGGKWERHWSYRPVEPEVPKGRGEVVDYWISRAIAEAGLTTSPPAPDAVWLRRVSLDLTGLLPDPEWLERFEESGDRAAYVDEVLASPRYGEHLAWSWLEAARYADTHGYQKDNLRSMWLWRDWVVDAYNRNLPFDQFTIEQLAGDLLPQPTEAQLIATGFQRNHRINGEAGAIPEEFLTETVVDRVDTFSTIWLGLTASCARCHDHKYDPLTQKEFFGLYAFFYNIDETGVGGIGRTEGPDIEVKLPGFEEAHAASLADLEKASAALKDAAQRERTLFGTWIEETREALRGAPLTLIGAPDQAHGTSDASTFAPLPDGSVRFGAANPLNDVHTLEWSAGKAPDKPLTHITLTALPDDAFPGGSLARSFAGDFLLSEITLHFGDQSVELIAIDDDRHREDFAAAKAVDGDPLTGWSPGPGLTQPVSARFTLTEPQRVSAADKMTVTLRYESREEQFMIGRPKLQFHFGDGDDAVEIDRSHWQALQKNDRSALQEIFQETHPRFADLRDVRDAARERLREVESNFQTKVMVMREREGAPRPTHILERGVYDQPGEKVEPHVPAYLELPLATRSGNNRPDRLDLARWLLHPDHPLTARVTVNRLWQHLFGTGLVASSEDFGIQGARPSHPELLDQLAADFIATGWDVKAMMKRLVLTETYARSSRRSPEQLAKDPENRLLASAPRHRLTGAVIRDQALQASGLLDESRGGPPVRPWQPPGLWAAVAGVNSNTTRYKPGPHSHQVRRSLYTLWKRSVPPPGLAMFDAATREVCSVTSTRTNTPLQALATLNDPVFSNAAAALARRHFSSGATASELIAAVWSRLQPLPIEDEPSRILTSTYEEHLAHYRKNPNEARLRIAPRSGTRFSESDALTQDPESLPKIAALTEVAEIVLNLDATLTRH